jgi:hypothetical protein
MAQQQQRRIDLGDIPTGRSECLGRWRATRGELGPDAIRRRTNEPDATSCLEIEPGGVVG